MKGYVLSLGKSPPSRPSSPSAKTNTSILPAKSVWNVFLPSYFPSWFPMIPNSGYHQLSLVDGNNFLSFQTLFWHHSFCRLLSCFRKKKKQNYFNGLSLLFRLKTKPLVWPQISGVWPLPVTQLKTPELSDLQPRWPYFSSMTWGKLMYISLRCSRSSTHSAQHRAGSQSSFHDLTKDRQWIGRKELTFTGFVQHTHTHTHTPC